MATVLFIAAHQDDEALSMGAAITNHIQNGHKVYVGCVTDGSASGVRGKNGTPSTVADFVKARNEETREFCATIGATFIEGSTARLVDGTLLTTEASTFPGDDGNDLRRTNPKVTARVKDLLSAVSKASGTPIKSILVKTHSHHDVHPDHRAVCQSVLYLLNVTKEIGDVRLYVSPGQWNSTAVYKGKTYKNATQLGAKKEVPPSTKNFIPTLHCFVKTTTTFKGALGRAKYGIGYISVSSLFETVGTEQCSYYHVPPVATLP